jgi:hypothetical protein
MGNLDRNSRIFLLGEFTSLRLRTLLPLDCAVSVHPAGKSGRKYHTLGSSFVHICQTMTYSIGRKNHANLGGVDSVASNHNETSSAVVGAVNLSAPMKKLNTGGQILDYGSFTHRQATTCKRREIPYHKKFFLTIFFPPGAGSFAAARATLTRFATCWIFGLVNKARNDLH